VQPLRQPALRAGLPDPGDLEASRRHRDDGLAPLHRLPLLHGRLPYGSRSFNWKDPRPAPERDQPNFPTRMRGVVEKCNFCAERLAVGKQPACVEACENDAIVFGDLNDPESEGASGAAEHMVPIRRKPGLGTAARGVLHHRG
jgi:ferredoxin